MNKQSNNKQKNSSIVNNVIWRFLEKNSSLVVSSIVSIVLSRLLGPSAYGTISLVTVFINILQVFIDSGLANSLIQKQNADDLDFSSVFVFNISLSLLLYIVTFISAPFIALFFNEKKLVSIIRVLSINLLISGIKNIQNAYVIKNMMFKKFFFSTLFGTVGGSIIGIYLAISGYGAWAIVYQNLFNNFVDMFVLWYTVEWKPKFIFSFERIKALLSFGWKLFFSTLIDTIYNNIQSLLIGRNYSSESLAFYDKGKHYPELLVSNLANSIENVSFPALSQKQNDRKSIKEYTRKSILISTYIITPMMAGLFVCAEPIFDVLFNEKWMPSVFYLRIFCAYFAFYPVHTANLTAIKSIGRSDIFLKLEIIKKIIGIISLIIAVNYGVKSIAIATLFAYYISQYIDSYPCKKLFSYGFLEQTIDLIPNTLLSTIMAALVYCISFFKMNNIVLLVIQIPFGVTLYLIISYITKNESYIYIKDYIRKQHLDLKSKTKRSL